MTDVQDPTVLDQITAQENALPSPAGMRPRHSLLFITGDGDVLMDLDADAMMTIPTVGEQVDLYDWTVHVTRVRTRYGRCEDTGRPEISTIVTVN